MCEDLKLFTHAPVTPAVKAESIAGVIRPSDAELVRRAIKNARPPIGKTREMRWVSVMDVFGVGSTSAYHLCQEAGLDPDEHQEGQNCEGCPLDEEEDDDEPDH